MIIRSVYYMGVETFRADSDLSDVLKDADFMRNFKNKTEMYNTAVKRLYNFAKGKPQGTAEPPLKPVSKAKGIRIV